uniref:Membrane insertase YidC n=1 Tax=Davidia involucrata TaxID=16924 RepID=A0A5B7BG90_DAVIN
MSERKAPPCPPSLYKQRSWSPDTLRDEAWSKRKSNHRLRRGRCKSVTDEDLDEIKACFELGFQFDSPDIDPKLSDTFPALDLYHAVNKQYSKRLSRSSSSSKSFDFDSSSSSSSIGSHSTILDTGDDPEMVKTRLKQWAQVVACSVRQFSPN